MAINLDNITTAFEKIKAVTNNISIISHNENVSIENIYPSEYNPYNEFDAQNDSEIVRQLADSIAVQGLIEPIVLNKVSPDRYIILSGERRYKAIKMLKWKYVSSQVYDNIDTTTANLILHTSNLEVRDYTSGQKLIFYKDVKKILEQVKQDGKLTCSMQKSLANMLHINERQVRKYERICNELSEDEQTQIINNEVSINSAYKTAQERKNNRSHNEEDVIPDDIDNDETTYPTPVEEEVSQEQEAVQEQATLNTQEIVDNTSSDVLDYIFRFYGKPKLISYYKSFIPTQDEGVEYLLSNVGYGFKLYISVDIINKEISINDTIYDMSQIDTMIREYIREEH